MRIALLILFSVLFSKHSAATECTTDGYKDKIFDPGGWTNGFRRIYKFSGVSWLIAP